MRLTDYQIRMYVTDIESLSVRKVANSRSEADKIRVNAERKRTALEDSFIGMVLNGQ